MEAKMYYQEKKTIATLLSGITLLGAYCFYVFQKYQTGVVDFSNDLKFWALTMLVFIGAGIVLTIVVLILFHIINSIINQATNQEDDVTMVEDEMDKLIGLKSVRNSFVVVGIGFILSLVSVVIKLPTPCMLNVIFLSFLIGSIVEGISQLYFYRKGVRNG